MPPLRAHSPQLQSPISPMRPKKTVVLPGFRAPPKPKPKSITQMTARELHDQHDRNARLLNSSSACTSALGQRLSAEQAAIESRLLDFEGVEEIRNGLKKTNINADEIMIVDQPRMPRVIDAKHRALSRYAPITPNGAQQVSSLSLQEAIELEQRAHAQDAARQQRSDERKRRIGLPIRGEVLSRAEMDARMRAFISYKPTDSDLEDDMDEDDEDDEDPSTWFEDDQDDGVKGQDIIEPDYEELSSIIRVDESRARYSTFFEPRDGD
ncbi:uncharacterized protein BJ212DRAFT_1478439 [Suillus subaureus]|uniref:Uncharacterized protein n=1 Tax=Suillus subaureus TaxID=48587 RepID=A0A9P7EFL5_9AGAM|nr:uncharacterized protein BJ212DRAFT_1478439 [Suillus subaureus]KAG1820311.1 hypothetical protein BJ212DRAFT_1478439 [Suillus subaureus]